MKITNALRGHMHLLKSCTFCFIISVLITLGGCKNGNRTGAGMDAINTNDFDARIVDSGDGRALMVDGRIRERVDTTDWQSHQKYAAVLELPRHYFSDRRRVLLIGLGAPSLVRRYRGRGWDVEVVEPESTIIQIARRSLGFSDSVVVVHNGDGRRFLETHGSKYDVIIFDVVSVHPARPHLLTSECFQLASRHLGTDGIVAVAFESFGWKDEMVGSIGATLATAFSNVLVLPIAEPPNQFGSIVLLASNRTIDDLLQDPDRNVEFTPDWRFSPDYQKAHAWDNHFLPDVHASRPQTDRHNTWKEFYEKVNDPARKDSAYYIP